MQRKKMITLKPLFLVTIIYTVFISPITMATNGFEPIGIGQAHKAMGGTAVANPLNTMSMATNPASASFIEDGGDIGLELFIPDGSATSSFFGIEYDANDKNVFLTPEAGYKKTINDKLSLGILAYGNGISSVSYTKSPAFPSPGEAGSELMPDVVFPPAGTPIPLNLGTDKTTSLEMRRFFISPTLSMKLNNNHSIGLSANFVYQRIDISGMAAVAGPSVAPAYFSDQGTDSATGVSATIGWMGQLSSNITAGISYRTQTSMSKFDKYKGYFALAGQVDVPAVLTAGFSIQASPKTTFALDIQRIYYKNVEALGNPEDAALLVGVATGQGWDDQLVYKIGVKHQLTPTLALMAGFNRGSSPFEANKTFINVVNPAVTEEHLTLGIEYQLSRNSKLVASYVHAFEQEQKGTNMFFDLKMKQNVFGIAYSAQF
jgi:long-chain fatty acid transport protein